MPYASRGPYGSGGPYGTHREPAHVEFVLLGQAGEEDIAQPITAAHPEGLVRIAIEVDAAQGIQVIKSRIIGQAGEEDIAHEFAWSRLRRIGQAREENLALAIEAKGPFPRFPEGPLVMSIEMAFGADRTANPETWDWTPVSTMPPGSDEQRLEAQSVTIQRGRADESQQTQPSSVSFVLRNHDGWLSPDNAESPYWPHVDTGTPCRVILSNLPVVLDTDRRTRLVGEVSSIAPIWPHGGGERALIDGALVEEAQVQVTAAGILRRLGQGQKPLRSSLYRRIQRETEQVGTDIVAWWPLDDPNTATSARRAFGGDGALRASAWFPMDVDLPAGNLPTQPPPSFGQPLFPVGGDLTTEIPSGWRLVGDVGVSGGWWVEAWLRPTGLGFSDETRSIGSNVEIRVTLDDGWFVQAIISERSTSGQWSARAIGSVSSGEHEVEAAFAADLPVGGGQLTVAVNAAGNQLSLWFNGQLVGSASYSSSPATINVNRVELRQHPVFNFEIVPPFEDIRMDPHTVRCGHLLVGTGTPSPQARFTAGMGHAGETALQRIERITTEENIPLNIRDPNNKAEDAVTLVGPQLSQTTLGIIREAALTDFGILTEQRRLPHLEYVPLGARYNQEPRLILDAAQSEITAPFGPLRDDQGMRNDVTVRMVDGVEQRVTDEDHIARFGIYDETINANPASATGGRGIAGWRLHLGTWPGEQGRPGSLRVNQISVDLAIAPQLIEDWLLLEPGDRLRVINLPSQFPLREVDLIVDGMTETFSPTSWLCQMNCSPYGPWEVGVIGEEAGAEDLDEPPMKLDTDGSELASGVNETATTLSVEVTAGELWTTDDDETPFQILVGGEEMTVTDISGTTSPQSFSVTRAVNGISKSHAAGTKVSLARPMVLAL